jgi:uncharacterized protein YukE
MDEQKNEQPNEGMSEEQQAARRANAQEISEELDKLADAFGRAVQAAWNSEQRKQLQEDLNRGLRTLVDGVEKSLTQFSESEQGQEVREQAGKVVEKVRTSKVTADLQQGLTKGLRAISEEMQEFAQKVEARKQADAQDPPAQDIPIDPAQTDSGDPESKA